jgi:hypothetical protein
MCFFTSTLKRRSAACRSVGEDFARAVRELSAYLVGQQARVDELQIARRAVQP